MKPRKIDQPLTDWLRKELNASGLLSDTFEIYVTDTECGRCNYNSKNITVPKWACVNAEDGSSIHQFHEFYWLYYVCHELAHSVTPTSCKPHGKEFMANFMRICPPELHFFELGYKPRNAAAAGIRRNT